MNEKAELLCVGDLILDLFLHIEKESDCATFDKTSNLISFLAGAKIMTDKVNFLPGGNANNVSVGCSRLGIKTAIMAETGNDEFSEILSKNLKKEKVNTKLILQTNSSATFSVNLFYINEKIVFIHHVKRNHDISFKNVNFKNIFLTSVGEIWEPFYEKVLSFTKTNKANLFFNPGSHQLEKGISSFRNILPFVKIIFINKEEAEKIVFGDFKNTDIKILLPEIKKMGPENVCITDGANGAYFLDSNFVFYYSNVLKIDNIINKTGAGDAFTAGFLSAYLKSEGIKTCLNWGSLNSKAVMEKIGAQTGLLKLKDLEKL